MLRIKGARVLCPDSGLDQVMDILLEEGKVAAMGNGLPEQEGETVIDARGLCVAPGLIDVHVHFRDPGQTHKETIQTGAEAAKKGGFTTVITMANTKPPVDNVETLQYVREEGKKTGIHVLPAACITKGMAGKELTDLEALCQAGAAGFTDDGIPLLDSGLCRKAMEWGRKLHKPLSFHEEDPAFIGENGINWGKASERLGIFGSPAVAEDSLVARDCMLALDTGAKVNIQHISSKNAVAMVRLAKSLGAHVTAEVTPHHFTLTEEAVAQHGAMAKMNPPLRTEEDRQALIEGLKDGTIDMIATDHAPHSQEEKGTEPLWKAPSGIIGLETALALGITELVEKGHLTLVQLMEKMSLAPARLYDLDAGYLAAGGPADLVLFDPCESWEVTEEELRSRSKNTPFLGRCLTGRVKYTICQGKVVYAHQG